MRRVQTVAPGVHRLGSRYINWYILEERGKLTVLDTGLPAYRRQLTAALTALGREPADVEAIILTHYHVDHAGAAAAVHARTAAPVFVHSADAATVRGERAAHRPQLPLTRPYFARYLLHLLANGATTYPTVANVTEFGDGEVLDVPGRPRVVHGPGHTPGSCALYLDGRSILFSGDILVTLNTGDGSKGPRVLSRFFQDDAGRALEAVSVLEPFDAKLMLPGHGVPWTGGMPEAVRLARAAGVPE